MVSIFASKGLKKHPWKYFTPKGIISTTKFFFEVTTHFCHNTKILTVCKPLKRKWLPTTVIRHFHTCYEHYIPYSPSFHVILTTLFRILSVRHYITYNICNFGVKFLSENRYTGNKVSISSRNKFLFHITNFHSSMSYRRDLYRNHQQNIYNFQWFHLQ